VRRLAAQARTDLLLRCQALLDEEQARFLAVLEAVGAAPDSSTRLRERARAVDDARLAQEPS
jgi:hypothetical protein